MNPGDRLVVVFIEPATVGDTFKQWTLHVTIVPWFRTEATTEELAHEWATKLTGTAPFEVSLGGEEGFGFKGKKLVNLIEGPSPLFGIHDIVRRSLKGRHAWMVDETTKKRRPFRPHVTHQGTLRLQEGDTFRCDKLHIIEQKGAYKEITGEVRLI